MEKKIIIHVGTQKTASTFLQKSLFPHLPGVTYIGRPYTQENKVFNLLQYADDSLYSHDDFKTEIEKIKNYNKKDNTILISDELFNGYPLYNFINRVPIAQRLSHAIPNAEVILFIRNQKELIISLYNQYVKIGWFNGKLDSNFLHKPGRGFSLDAWWEGNRSWDRSNRFIDHRSFFNINHLRYSVMIKLYKDLFSNVHVFLYEDLLNNKEECVKRMNKILGTEDLPPTIINESRRVNRSLKREQLKNRIIENRLSSVFNANETTLGKLSSKILARALSYKINIQELEKSNRQYLEKILNEEKIFEDNIIANDKWSIGMEKFGDKYFE